MNILANTSLVAEMCQTMNPSRRTEEPSTPISDEVDAPRAYSIPDPSPPPWQLAQVEEKSVPLAIVLAVLVPGLGHVYLRRFAQGAAIFIVVAALLLLFFLIVTVAVAAAIWAWQVYDAYRMVKEYNRAVRESGARPW